MQMIEFSLPEDGVNEDSSLGVFVKCLPEPHPILGCYAVIQFSLPLCRN
jgi:hypothetical protein